MITVDDIANKHFRRALLGYDSEHVDVYLDEIIAQLNSMHKERKEMVDTIEHLTAALARSGAVESSEETFGEPISPHSLK